MPDEDRLAELQAESEKGDRLDSEVVISEGEALAQAINEELDAIESGDVYQSVTIWDKKSTALIRALEKNPEHLKQVGTELREQIGVSDSGEVDRGEVLRYALRLGLQQAADEQLDILRDVIRDRSAQDI